MNTLAHYFTGILIILSLSVISQNRSINFEHKTLKELKEKALKENKLIFIDAYTTWCGPCKQMANQTFTDDAVADYYNSNFINAKFDMEKGEGLALAKQYEVMCYPNLLYIDGNGNIVHRTAGGLNPNEFMALAQIAKDPHHNFSYYKTNYETKKTDSEFLVKYIAAISNTCLDPKTIVTQYFSLQKEEDLTSFQNWNLISDHITDMESREFKYLLAHKLDFENLYTRQNIDRKINDVAQSSLINIIKTKPFDVVKYNQTKEKIAQMNLENTKMILFEADLKLAEKNKNWVAYSKLAIENVDKYYSQDPNILNSISWSFYENISDKLALEKAEAWAKLSTELDPNYANLDTYAALLYKNSNKALALETANKAIEFAKKEGYSTEDYKSTSELIKNIKLIK